MPALEILALNTTTPQIQAPQTGDTYAAPRTISITPQANTSAFAVTGFSLTGTNAQALGDLTGTWNTTGTPTAILLNITDTASNASSLLMDLRLGGISRFRVGKGVTTSANAIEMSNYFLTSQQVYIRNNSATVAQIFLGTADDVQLFRDGTDAFAQRRSTNGQTKRIYGTYTDGSNYRRVAIAMTNAGVASIAPEGAGTGASGNVLHISGLPTSNPGVGILWNDGGTVKVGT